MIVTIFRSRLNPGAEEEYAPMAKRMSELARTIPGYLSHKGFAAEDGERVTIVEFETEQALDEWRHHPEHAKGEAARHPVLFQRLQIPNMHGHSGSRVDFRAVVQNRRPSLQAGELWAEKPLRLKSIFISAINLICPVQPSAEKYSASVVGQISGLNPRVSPE
jgi:heme-degrading monooxygenase HmoA